MKESRFIELLNLCVDQQLNKEEAVELDIELQRHPARRRTYQQYCRMQKACALIFEAERANAPASPALARALAAADRKASRPHAPATPWWRSLYAFGGLGAAAAACVVAIFVARSGSTTPSIPKSPSVAAQVQQTAVPAVASAQPAAASAQPAQEDMQDIGIRLRPTFSNAHAQPAVQFASTQPSNIANDAALVWTQEVKLNPIRKVSTEDMILDLRRVQKREIGTDILRPTFHAEEEAEEIVAFEIHR